jgi:hypothetical protein
MSETEAASHVKTPNPPVPRAVIVALWALVLAFAGYYAITCYFIVLVELPAAVPVVAAFALIPYAPCFVLIPFTFKGRNWARTALVVFVGFWVSMIYSSLRSGWTVDWISETVGPYLLVAQLAATAVLFCPPSDAWFAKSTRGD